MIRALEPGATYLESIRPGLYRKLADASDLLAISNTKLPARTSFKDAGLPQSFDVLFRFQIFTVDPMSTNGRWRLV
jgi:hypothetical protein